MAAPRLATPAAPALDAPPCAPPHHHLLDPAIRGFQVTISPGDGARCPYVPSCSAFGRQALARDGWLGLPVLFARFERESAGDRHHPLRLDSGRVAWRDPLAEHPPLLDLLRPDPELPGLAP